MAEQDAQRPIGGGDLEQVVGEARRAGDGLLDRSRSSLIRDGPEDPREDWMRLDARLPVPLILRALSDHRRQVFGGPIDLDEPAQLPAVRRGQFNQ